MKIGISLVVFSAIIAWCVGTSPQRCGRCSLRFCIRQACPCGSFKDECQCCDRCLKCPGETCNFLAGDRCLVDMCRPPPGSTVAELLMKGLDGRCPYPDSIAEHQLHRGIEDDHQNEDYNYNY